MDISRGFQIELPELFIPWKISPSRLQRMFAGRVLRRVSENYFTTSCTSLSGLDHVLGFRFHRWFFGLFGPARLMALEFYHNPSPPDLAASYDQFQHHLESTFGKPTRSFPGSKGFDTHVWELETVRITHCIFERFTVGESVCIEKL